MKQQSSYSQQAALLFTAQRRNCSKLTYSLPSMDVNEKACIRNGHGMTLILKLQEAAALHAIPSAALFPV